MIGGQHLVGLEADLHGVGAQEGRNVSGAGQLVEAALLEAKKDEVTVIFIKHNGELNLIFEVLFDRFDAAENDQTECANCTQNVAFRYCLVFSSRIVLIIKGAQRSE